MMGYLSSEGLICQANPCRLSVSLCNRFVVYMKEQIVLGLLSVSYGLLLPSFSWLSSTQLPWRQFSLLCCWLFVSSGAFHCPPFTPPADRVDEHVGKQGWSVISASGGAAKRDFQKEGCALVGTAGWRWSLWESLGIFNYLTQHQALA